MSDEGFGRNLAKVFGNGDLYEGLGQRPLKAIALSADKETLTFTFQDGGGAVEFGVEGDCCSHSWIEHVTAPDNIEGAVLVSATDERISSEDDNELRVYNTKFQTDRGDTIVLEYRNESNGYYGGYLVRKAKA